MSEAIKVVVRVRPMNTKQKQRGCLSIASIDQTNNQITITKPDQTDNVKSFAFDSVFGENSEQAVVYTKTAYNLVENVITGYNGTIFAYGQTGCGKTHSMVGKVQIQELQGIIPRSFGHILKTISDTKDKEFLLRCSFIEIYNEEVRDLLGKDVKAKLQVKESPDKGVFIKDLSINSAKTHTELMEYMNIGNKNRAVGQTAMNKDSSRSHLLFMLYLESCNITESDDKKYIASKLNLVDLAGSERLSKTGAAGDRLKEAQKINLSLSALGNVISALVDGKSQHIPYRDSKLTRLLQDSLGGNTKTVMIANCSPADYNFDETLSTLRYASRAKFIKNKPIINEDPKDALLKEYASEIKKLREMIEKGGPIQMPIAEKQDTDRHEMNERLKEKEAELLNQKTEKQKLLAKIKQLQSRHIVAQDVEIDEKVKQNIKKILQIKQKTKTCKKISVLLPDDVNIEEEQQNIEKQSSGQQIQKKYIKLVKKLKDKIKHLQIEIKDVSHENFVDKESILQDLRGITKQNKFFESVLNVILQPSQIEAIRQASDYNEEKQDYRVPPFYLKNKMLVFPKLQEGQSMDLIRQMQDGRQIQWDKDKQEAKQNIQINHSNVSTANKYQPRKSIQKSPKEYAVNDLIKEARLEKHLIMQTKEEKQKKSRKVLLEPITKL